jgi:hypothetical protein
MQYIKICKLLAACASRIAQKSHPCVMTLISTAQSLQRKTSLHLLQNASPSREYNVNLKGDYE